MRILDMANQPSITSVGVKGVLAVVFAVDGNTLEFSPQHLLQRE